MKVNELMIGDWVYNSHHKKNINITAYDFFTHSHIDGVQSFEGILNPIPILGRDLEPIPLTEEILKANGFELDEDGWHYRYYIEEEDDFFILYLTEGRIDISIAENEMILRYVHLLQHALRLCGLSELANNFKIE